MAEKAKLNMEYYSKFRAVPKEAIKPIMGGKLKGFSDINPQWRFEVLTNVFGAAGERWYYDVVTREIIDLPDGQKVAFMAIKFYYATSNGEWSAPLYGEGGSFFVQKTKNGLEVNDDAFKMALTDAISIAVKPLGVGADVWFNNSVTKYTKPQSDGSPKTTTAAPANAPAQPSEADKKMYEALSTIQEIATLGGLESFWKANPDMQKNPKFKDAVVKRKAELQA